jgi:anthranilate/para-aminobenzoate synthase component II
VHRLLAHKLVETLRRGATELELDDGDLKAIGRARAERHDLPPELPESLAVMASLSASSAEAFARGDFRLWLDGLYGSSVAAIVGRFCHGHPGLLEKLRALVRREEASSPDAVYAEIIHLPAGRAGNVVLRPILREREIPYLGLCLGMHVVVSEYARHVLGLEGANSTEMDPETPHPVIDLLPEQKEIEDLGGTMRLGAQAVELAEGTRAHDAYGETVIHERHRHRYEVNNHYRPALVDGGLVVSGTFQEGRLVEIVELPDHPWFVASQFHPEFKSRPTRPAPLFRGFVEAALARARMRQAHSPRLEIAR